MPANDLVPCFYTGQNYRWERPARIETRAKVRDLKTLKLGRFIENGKVFLFSQAIEKAALNVCEGPIGVGNAIPFSRKSDGQKIHYEVPMAGDRSVLARHRRPLIHVSGRLALETAAMTAVANFNWRLQRA